MSTQLREHHPHWDATVNRDSAGEIDYVDYCIRRPDDDEEPGSIFRLTEWSDGTWTLLINEEPCDPQRITTKDALEWIQNPVTSVRHLRSEERA